MAPNAIMKEYKVKRSPLIVLALLFSLVPITASIAYGITDDVMELEYRSDTGHHIQEAFNTVSGPASSEQLGIAIASIERAGLDTGYTDAVWRSKGGDLGFWHRTLVQAKADVDRASYEKAWAPEADENVILARHYRVLSETYGSDLSPDNIEWVSVDRDLKWVPFIYDIFWTIMWAPVIAASMFSFGVLIRATIIRFDVDGMSGTIRITGGGWWRVWQPP